MRLTEHWRLKSERYMLQSNQNQADQENCLPARPVNRREVTLYDFSAKQDDYAWTHENLTYAEAKR